MIVQDEMAIILMMNVLYKFANFAQHFRREVIGKSMAPM